MLPKWKTLSAMEKFLSSRYGARREVGSLLTFRKSAFGRDKLGKSTAQASVTQLCSVWNSVVFRSTTKSEDIPIILANLLDYNAYAILREEPHSNAETEAEKFVENRRVEGCAMRAILWSLGYLPVSLLCNNGPRMRSNEFHKNRWVPLCPAGNMLSPDWAFVKQESEFSLDSKSREGKATATDLILIRSPPQKLEKATIELSSRKVEYVIFDRSPDDTFQHDQFEATCILLDVSGDRGACFQVSSMSP